MRVVCMYACVCFSTEPGVSSRGDPILFPPIQGLGAHSVSFSLGDAGAQSKNWELYGKRGWDLGGNMYLCRREPLKGIE